MKQTDGLAVGCAVWAMILGLVAVLIWANCASADPIEVEVGPHDQGGAAVHEIEGALHVLNGLVAGEWQHYRDGAAHCFQAGPPPPGADPDSIYFYPRKPGWIALVSTGAPISWATCDGIPYGSWRYSTQSPGYVAMLRDVYQRYSVAFAYMDAAGQWDGTWDFRIRQEGPP